MSALPEGILASLFGRTAFIPAVVEDLGNPPWETAPQRILIVRLSGFRDVQKSSSHLVLFSETRRALPLSFVDFAFLPERQERKALEARGLPWFSGLVSGRSPRDFDLVLASNAFGLELVNLPHLFSTSRIPPRASERGEEEPLLVMGGSNAASSGAVLFGGEGPGADSFFDGIFFGEGEGAIGDLVRVLADRGRPRSERLRAASAIEGFWRSGSGIPARRRVLRPMPPPLVSYPVLNSDEAGTARLQITAGCPGYCSFCLEGWDRRPYREADLPSLLSAARELKRRSGADTLELFSFNFNTHARIYALLFELNRIFRRVNLMSQRLDLLARERPLVRAELAADKRSFTLGVEGLSARMRRYFRKGLDDRDLDAVLAALFVPGVREIKLFYILAGFEGSEDLAEFALFARKLRTMRETGAPGLRVIVSAGYLVRLPFTPLQFAPLALEESDLARISSAVRGSCEENGIEFRLAVDFDDYLADQLLALGGSALADWLLGAPARGFVFDGTLPHGAAASLAEHARERGLLEGSFRNEKDRAWRPPLAFVEEDSRHDRLYAHYLEARAFRDRSSCLGSGCSDCGACDDPEDRAFLAGHKIEEGPGDFPERLGRLLAAKRSFARIFARVDVPASLLGATDSYRAAWLLRRLAAASPGVEPAVFEAREALFSEGPMAGMLGSCHGLCVFALFGPDAEAVRKAARSAGLDLLDAAPEPSAVEVEIGLSPPYGAGAYAALRSWLSAERIEVVERRLGGKRLLEPGGRDLKKHCVYRVEIDDASEEGAFTARLSLGRKARLASWLDRLGAKAARSASIRVTGYRD
ncbi:MAG TPA: radical SAM protein [Rectinemataceae bacterium]|nr:radical SAM protein [Rectinemataceae bacterium]